MRHPHPAWKHRQTLDTKCIQPGRTAAIRPLAETQGLVRTRPNVTGAPARTDGSAKGPRRTRCMGTAFVQAVRPRSSRPPFDAHEYARNSLHFHERGPSASTRSTTPIASSRLRAGAVRRSPCVHAGCGLDRRSCGPQLQVTPAFPAPRATTGLFTSFVCEKAREADMNRKPVLASTPAHATCSLSAG